MRGCALLLLAPVGALQAVTKAAPRPSPADALTALSDGYTQLVSEHYLPVAFSQAAVLASGADVATQLMEHSVAPPASVAPFAFGWEYVEPILRSWHLIAPPTPPDPVNLCHVLAMATVASTMSGGANAVWLRQLEAVFPGQTPRNIAAKTLIHAVILASIINSAYLVGVPLLTDGFAGGFPPLTEPSAYFAGWTLPEFVTLTKLEICMFIPYNALAFRYVPPRVRPLTHACVSATFNVAVSAVTLGYFDAWCERATHVFG